MACACGSKTASGANKTYTVTSPSGEKKTYRSEVEATSAARRVGGTWKASS
jgi:hypothetical protein